MICTFLCAPFLIKAQTEFLFKADSLFHNGEYGSAALFYERAFFESHDVSTSSFAILKKVDCLKKQNLFTLALAQLDKIRFDLLPKDVQPKWRYERAFCSYMSDNFSQVEKEFEFYNVFINDTAFRRSMLFLETAALINEFKWQEAKTSLQQYIQFAAADSLQKMDLTAKAEKILNHHPKYKDPDKARQLSIMPGLGQLYSGYPAEGAFSFILNAAALSFGVYHVLNGFPITGYFGGAGMLQAFYFGGQNRAAILSVRSNERKRKAVCGKIITLMNEVP